MTEPNWWVRNGTPRGMQVIAADRVGVHKYQDKSVKDRFCVRCGYPKDHLVHNVKAQTSPRT